LGSLIGNHTHRRLLSRALPFTSRDQVDGIKLHVASHLNTLYEFRGITCPFFSDGVTCYLKSWHERSSREGKDACKMDAVPSHLISSRGVRMVVVSISLTILAACAVAARLFTRMRIVRCTGFDDWIILVSLIFSSIFTGFAIGEMLHGIGGHDADVGLHEIEVQIKLLWFSVPFMHASMGCTKSSIILLYLRLFPIRRMRFTCRLILGILIVWYTWAVLSAIFTCIPVSKFWNPTLAGHCFNFQALWFSNASINIVTDLTLIILPIPVISSLHLPRKQKVGIWLILAIGSSVFIASIIRLKSLLIFSVSQDRSWDSLNPGVWSYVECNLAIFCACLPCLRPLYYYVFPSPCPQDGLVARRVQSDPECSMEVCQSVGS